MPAGTGDVTTRTPPASDLRDLVSGPDALYATRFHSAELLKLNSARALDRERATSADGARAAP